MKFRPAVALAGFVIAIPAQAVELKGDFIQGGLVRGTAAPGARVRFEGRPIRVSDKGVFLIGFSRDAAGTARLEIRGEDGRVEARTLKIKARKYKLQRIDGLPPKMVTPPPSVLRRIRRENAMIGAARRRDSAETWFENGWMWPVEGPISGVYGRQRILNGKPRRPHYGVDIAAPAGTPVVAPADGVVALAERDLYYTGGTLVIDHGHGLSSAFLHMASVEVEVGRRVRKGVRVGTLGATGRATGPHLDWRINLFKARLDPALLVPPMPKPAAR